MRIQMEQYLLLFVVAMFGINNSVLAQQEGLVDLSSQEIVEYRSEFFQRYSPNTALDMIRQVPGFQLDDGDASRGLGAAAGNVLINDRRPSAKQDLPSLILSRIPASLVERIELIRGQVRDIDMQGDSVLANIILREDSPAAIRWDSSWRYNVEFGHTFEGSTSISDRWRETDYNAGIQFRKFTRGDYTFQDSLDIDDVVTEIRDDESFFLGYRGNANLNTSTWVGETFLQFNTTLFGENRDGDRMIRRLPQPPAGGKRDELIGEEFKTRRIEFGVDAERSLRSDLNVKAILLHVRGKSDNLTSLRRLDSSAVQTLLRVADTSTKSSEAIVRTELDWTYFSGHAIQINLEGAFNSLEGSLFQTEDTGTGQLVVDVPGANARVEEIRGDFLIKDTWSLGNIELGYGIGAEVSEITQSGDGAQSRNFFFLKPEGTVTYAPKQSEQTRLRFAREVSQLDFEEFVSGTVFEDDDLALGNPNLQPETTWLAQLSHERRFGQQSVVKLSAFYNWITNVVDLLPLSSTFEAVGNIGSGNRYGVEIETTIPLESIGLTGARLDINARWQDSSVTDPVTGENRILSTRTPNQRLLPLGFRVDNKYAFTIDYRQDFQKEQVAWGWEIRERANRILFKVNELDNSNEGIDLSFFVETTRWLGLKMGFNIENVLNIVSSRDRTIFTGERDLSPIDEQLIQNRVRSFRLAYVVSGSF
ncbi:MAG: hypothetical protein ACI9XC_001399 [Gammaproteobacteria bacterium]|jgi:hypothetical protein